MTTYTEILQAALGLPPHERGELADVLLELMDLDDHGGGDSAEISSAWRDEFARRSEAYVRGEVTGIPWQQVRDDLRRKYGNHA